MTEINELTPTLVNSLIERIEVHNNDKSSGHCYVKVDIYFTAVGMIDIPDETNHYEFTYDIDGDTLKVDYALDYVTDCEYTYTVDGDKLTLMGGNDTVEPGKVYELSLVKE